MDILKDLLKTLAHESGGGVTSKPAAAHGIRAAVLFLEDGQVVYWGPPLKGGAPQ